jgi:hypothetical protein
MPDETIRNEFNQLELDPLEDKSELLSTGKAMTIRNTTDYDDYILCELKLLGLVESMKIEDKILKRQNAR